MGKVVIKECAAKIGARRCQHSRVEGKMFCSHHLTSGQRFQLPVYSINPDLLDTKAVQDYRRGYR